MARIVIADDHEVVRKGLVAIIAGHPEMEVCGVAENGQDAVDRVIELKPDVIILDLSMPVMNGFQAALKIRRIAPSIKILVLSTHDASTVEQVATLMGADAYLSKTAASEKVLSAVLSLLDQRGSRPDRPIVRKSSSTSSAGE